jgi:hypothetical protein
MLFFSFLKGELILKKINDISPAVANDTLIRERVFGFKIYFSTYFHPKIPTKHHKNLLKPSNKPKTLQNY